MSRTVIAAVVAVVIAALTAGEFVIPFLLVFPTMEPCSAHIVKIDCINVFGGVGSRHGR